MGLAHNPPTAPIHTLPTQWLQLKDSEAPGDDRAAWRQETASWGEEAWEGHPLRNLHTGTVHEQEINVLSHKVLMLVIS